MGKPEVRKEISNKLISQTKEEKLKKDEVIKKKILSLSEFKEAKVVAFYMSIGSEVDTGALIDGALAEGKRVVVPAIVGDDLKFYEIKNRKAGLAEGPYGILQPDTNCLEPFPNEEIGLIIVPGAAFTRDGARLGRGRGFYDRFLKGLPSRVKKIGLAYDLQIIEDLPVTPHDIPVDIVVTN